MEAYINRGSALCKLLWYEPAVANYDKAIALSPNNAEAHYFRGVALVALERHEAAVASFDKVLTLGADFKFSYGARPITFTLANLTKVRRRIGTAR